MLIKGLIKSPFLLRSLIKQLIKFLEDSMSKKKARLKDVAQLAGVSTTTASVVLNGRIGDNTRVAGKTHKCVLERCQ